MTFNKKHEMNMALGKLQVNFRERNLRKKFQRTSLDRYQLNCLKNN